MTDNGLFNFLVVGLLVTAPITFFYLMTRAAPYGRHAEGKKQIGLPTRVAWMLMESPSCLFFAWVFFHGSRWDAAAPIALFLLWQFHYAHRTFVYPLQMTVRPGDTTPLSIVGASLVFNMINSYLNGNAVSGLGRVYEASWLMDPRFILGGVLFIAGWLINKKADAMLRNLREPGETGYKIPRGWLYERISCPNYFGELVTWLGWAIASWSLAGLAFFLFTFANLGPRAIANHKWYREKFPDYPAGRKALVPFVW